MRNDTPAPSAAPKDRDASVEPEGWGLWRCAAWLLLMVLMYVGSIGPVTLLSCEGYIPYRQSTLSHPAYQPLRWLSSRSETFRLYLMRYETMCRNARTY